MRMISQRRQIPATPKRAVREVGSHQRPGDGIGCRPKPRGRLPASRARPPRTRVALHRIRRRQAQEAPRLGKRVAEAHMRAARGDDVEQIAMIRSEEHTSELQSLMRISYAVFCLKKKKQEERHKQYINILIGNTKVI